MYILIIFVVLRVFRFLYSKGMQLLVGMYVLEYLKNIRGD